MRTLAIFLFGGVMASAALSQTSKPTAKPSKPKQAATGRAVPHSTKTTAASVTKNAPIKPSTSSLAKPAASAKKVSQKIAEKQVAVAPDDSADWQKAAAITDPSEKLDAMRRFLRRFPSSDRRIEAQVAISAIEAALASDKLTSGDAAGAADLYRSAVADAPEQIPAELFENSFAKVPVSLFFAGQSEAAFAVAKALEKKSATSVPQLLSLAGFYMNIENGSEARRLGAAAAKLDPTSSGAEQTLGLASRMEFDLEASAEHYAKALELAPDSLSARRGLAEMKRALGKSDEAVQLYKEILTKDETNVPARTGLILALFDSGDRANAETELAGSLEANPGNVILLAGAAYWYAANNEGAKAVEYAQKAIDADPRFIWSHIALGRGYLAQNKAAEAEKTFLKARRYGNFPTLDYELAAARMAGGFYREAAEGLAKTFSIKDGVIHANLGGHIAKDSRYFTELVGYERRASIFAPAAADTPEVAARMSALLALKQDLDSQQPNADDLSRAVDDFVRGDDRMKVHRELYAAGLLLDKKVALPKVVELSRAAVESLDAGLDIPDAPGAVMAGELYERRSVAAARGEYVVLPSVDRTTLSQIMRGRVEEIGGWALYQMDKPDEAVIRLKRAITILPADSAWWRSSTWRLGAALSAAGKDSEALDYYVKSYKSGGPDPLKYAVVEAVFKKVNGNTDGLEGKIGPRPAGSIPLEIVSQQPQASPSPAASPADQKPAVDTAVTDQALPKATPEPKPVPDESPAPVETRPQTIPVEKQTIVEAKQSPSETPADATPMSSPSPSAARNEAPAKVEADPTPSPSPEPEQKVEQTAVKQTAEPTPSPVVISEQPKSPVVADPTPQPTPSDDNKPTDTDKQAPAVAKGNEPVGMTVAKNAPEKPSVPLDPKREETTQANQQEKRDDSQSTVPPAPADERPATSVTEPSAKTGSLFPPVIITIPPPPQQRRQFPSNPVAVPPCKLTTSEDSVTLHTDGSDIAVIVRRDDDRDVSGLRATSSSPDDIAVRREQIDGVKGRALYVIHASSAKTGVYQVSFELPCGKKDLVVKVL